MTDLCVPLPTVIELVIEDERLPKPLTIRTRSVSLGEWLEISKTETSMLDGFCDALQSWNLAKPGSKGRPVKVPATRDGLLDQEPWLIRKVLATWRRGLIGVPGPLEPSSNGGDPSVEASLPMAPSSDDHES